MALRYFNSSRFGAALRKALKNAAIQQTQVSEETEINRSTISQIISGKKMNVDYLARLLPYIKDATFEDFVDDPAPRSGAAPSIRE